MFIGVSIKDFKTYLLIGRSPDRPGIPSHQLFVPECRPRDAFDCDRSTFGLGDNFDSVGRGHRDGISKRTGDDAIAVGFGV